MANDENNKKKLDENKNELNSSINDEGNNKDNLENQIENLISRIDLPGDKDIDRAPIILETSENKEKQSVESENIINDMEYLKSSKTVSYDDRPELKSDKGKRINSKDLNLLFDDLNKSISGQNISKDEPIFGETLKEKTKKNDLKNISFEKELRTIEKNDSINKLSHLENETNEKNNLSNDFIENLNDLDNEIKQYEIKNPVINYDNIKSPEKSFNEYEIENFENLDQYIEKRNIEKSLSSEDSLKENNIISEFDNLSSIESLDESKKENFIENDNQKESEINESNVTESVPDLNKLSESDLSKKDEEKSTTNENEIFKPDDIPEASEEELLKTFSETSFETEINEKSPTETLKDSFEFQNKNYTNESDKKTIQETENINSILPNEEKISINNKDEKNYSENINNPNKYSTTENPNNNGLNFTSEEIEIIKNNLKNLPENISNVATKVITEEILPFKDMKIFTNMLINNATAQDIQKFLDNTFDKEQKIDQITKKIYPSIQKKKPKKSRTLQKVSLLAFLLIASGIGTWIAFINPYMNREKIYAEGLQNIRQGTNHYIEAIEKFKIASKNSVDINWLNKYIEELIKQGTPESLYLAHNLSLGRSPENEKWLQKYQNIIKKRILNPGQEEKLNLNYLWIDKSILEIDKNNKKARLNIGKIFKNKAYYADKFKKNLKDIEYYFDQAIKQGYNPLIEIDPENEEYWGLIAQTEIEWGKIIAKYSPIDKDHHLKNAEEIYNKLNPKGPIKLFGLMNLSLTEIKLLNAKKEKKKYEFLQKKLKTLYTFIDKLDFNTDKINYSSLNEYAFYLNKVKQENKLAKNILHTSIKKGPIDAKAYYYLGQIYHEESHINTALEIYIKGLFSYYYHEIGEKNFNERIYQNKNLSEQAEILKIETLRVIQSIQKDSNIKNNIIQSKLFLNIALAYLVLEEELRSTIVEENKEKNKLMTAVKNNLYLALQKNETNIKAWKILGDLAYKKNILFNKKLIKNLSKNRLKKVSSVKEFLLKEQFKEAKSYYFQALNLMINKDNKNNQVYKNFDQKMEHFLIKKVENKNVDENILYKIAYILYREKHYNMALKIWHAIRSNARQKFNPLLNFALGNSYLLSEKRGEAKRFFSNVIDFYEEVALRYRLNPDPKNLRQNEVFSKLAATHNNIGVAYHLDFEKLDDDHFLEKARYHYYRAAEYASKLNNEVLLQKAKINQRSFFKKIIYVENNAVKLSKRKIIDLNSGKKVKLTLDQMIINDIEPFLKRS